MVKKRKGMDAAVLSLALGVVILLVVLGVIVGLNTSGSFKDFLAKVPWLNKIVPVDDTSDGGGGGPGGGSVVAPPGKPSGDVVYLVAARKSTSTDRSLRVKISDGVPSGESIKYNFKKGDTLEYDVYLPLKTPCTGGMGLVVTANGKDIDLGDDNKWVDSTGKVSGGLKNCNPDPKKVVTESDLTPYTYDKKQWYHRVIPIPDVYAGAATLKEVRLLMNGGTPYAMYIAVYDNIIIKSPVNGKDYIIYKDGAPKFSEIDCGSAFGTKCNFDEDKTKVIIRKPASITLEYDIKSVAGEILKLSAISDGGGCSWFDSSGCQWLYLKAFELGSAYTVQPGDIVEYDVYLGKCAKEVGGIDLRDKSGSIKWSNMKDYYWDNMYDWDSTKIISGRPDDSGMDLGTKAGEIACLKWYHRKLPAAPNMWGKAVEIVDLAIGYDAGENEQVNVYYDNLQITDGIGQVKAFYPGGVDIVLYQFDEKNDNGGIRAYKKDSVSLTKINPADIDHPT
ncbi:MAG: hypothetical protein HYT71_01405 [Candidatus Aenigmarchaeota archaeon]|nr:hypothetical protein [Candidatus Aenigmarchaeota archaeon]